MGPPPIRDDQAVEAEPAPSFTALDAHVRAYFAGHDVELVHFDAGPIRRRVPDFHVFRIAPGPRIALWSFITSGTWAATPEGGHGLEFVLAASTDDALHIEHLAMTASLQGDTRARGA